MGEPLHLLQQERYTSGRCDVFALAAQRVIGGELRLLYCADERQFEEHDWPESEPLCLHVCLEMPDGMFVDAEGVRPLPELLRSFGVKPGWDYRMEEDRDGSALRSTFPRISEELVAATEELLLEHGWQDGVPPATGELTRRWKSVQAMKGEAFDRAQKAPISLPAPPSLSLIPSAEVNLSR